MAKKRRIDLKPKMRPVEGKPGVWNIAPLVHINDLAGWLGIARRTLLWLSNGDTTLRQEHYVYRWIRKRTGMRLIESPKPLLKKVQRQILHELLCDIPASTHAHGFIKKRDVKTFTAEHVGQPLILKMDLRNFFPSVGAGRIFRLYSRLGYPTEVARVLTGLCTTATPSTAFQSLQQSSVQGQRLREVYATGHLPQGAPTSPALANFCAYKLDQRLAGLAAKLNGRFSRYADDLLFSFDDTIARNRQAKNWVRRLANQVAVIAIEEGFDVNFRKTRVMSKSQRQLSAGIVLNQKQNLPRQKYDCLKAIIHNCLVHGPTTQNRACQTNFQDHLSGQIAWFEQINPAKGAKLRKRFEQIRWANYSST